ncbi:MAG: hypothetical protein NC123_11075 [Butyrivibrio sp.]|nr:hypothetical protein [Acetatifactor muris]MCM1560066.1 hypothetical protein [Butyrivibrio sp.]
MSTDRRNQIMVILSIIERGRAKAYIEMLDRRSIGFHMQCVGQGTASSEMMDILGLGSSDKDIVVSYAPRRQVAALAAELTKDLSSGMGYNGLMMLLSTSAINYVAAELLLLQAANAEKGGEESGMKSEYHHSLILITVNQGYTDGVMQTAKKAGATGGTVIRARLAGAEQIMALQAQEEKEIIAILASDSVRNQIMEEVNKEFGLRSEARGVVCAVPVDKAMKI